MPGGKKILVKGSALSDPSNIKQNKWSRQKTEETIASLTVKKKARLNDMNENYLSLQNEQVQNEPIASEEERTKLDILNQNKR